jgi:hypothetical protein
MSFYLAVRVCADAAVVAAISTRSFLIVEKRTATGRARVKAMRPGKRRSKSRPADEN